MLDLDYKQNKYIKSFIAKFIFIFIIIFLFACCYIFALYVNSVFEAGLIVSDNQFPHKFLDYFYSRFNFLYAGLIGIVCFFLVWLVNSKNISIRVIFGFILMSGPLLILYAASAVISTVETTLEKWVIYFQNYPITNWFYFWQGLGPLLLLLFSLGFHLVFFRRSRQALYKDEFSFMKWNTFNVAILIFLILFLIAYGSYIISEL